MCSAICYESKQPASVSTAKTLARGCVAGPLGRKVFDRKSLGHLQVLDVRPCLLLVGGPRLTVSVVRQFSGKGIRLHLKPVLHIEHRWGFRKLHGDAREEHPHAHNILPGLDNSALDSRTAACSRDLGVPATPLLSMVPPPR